MGPITGEVLAAIITSVVSGIATIASIILSSRLTVYRIGQLEKKVEKHNNLVERMAIVEQSAKSAHHRLDDLADR